MGKTNSRTIGSASLPTKSSATPEAISITFSPPPQARAFTGYKSTVRAFVGAPKCRNIPGHTHDKRAGLLCFGLFTRRGYIHISCWQYVPAQAEITHGKNRETLSRNLVLVSANVGLFRTALDHASFMLPPSN